MNNVIYMFRCQDSTLVIKGKVNSIVMDSCRKSSVVFDSVVSSIEFVNCQSVQMQVCYLFLSFIKKYNRIYLLLHKILCKKYIYFQISIYIYNIITFSLCSIS